MTPTQTARVTAFNSATAGKPNVGAAPYSSITAAYAQPTTADLEKKIEGQETSAAGAGYSDQIFGGRKAMVEAIMRKLGVGA